MPIATGQTPHPHLPPPLGVLSEWQRTVRQHPLLNSNSDAPLPQEANVVIVGSGMCGAYLPSVGLCELRLTTDIVCRCRRRQLAFEGERSTGESRRARGEGDLLGRKRAERRTLSPRPS